MITERQPDPTEEAARAAREAAEEATDPKARFFLTQHANRLARLAAARRADATRRLGAIAPFLPLATL
jgi:hypothetical protein